MTNKHHCKIREGKLQKETMKAKVIPCRCKYWEDEEFLFDDFQGQALIIDGSPCCVECGAELKIKESETDQSNKNTKKGNA